MTSNKINFIVVGDYSDFGLTNGVNKILINTGMIGKKHLTNKDVNYIVDLDESVVQGAFSLYVQFKDGKRCILDLSMGPYTLIKENCKSIDRADAMIDNSLLNEYLSLEKIIPSQEIQQFMNDQEARMKSINEKERAQQKESEAAKQYGKYDWKEIELGHIDGLPNAQQNEIIHIQLVDDQSKILFQSKATGNKVNLPYEKLKRVAVVTEVDILTIEKDKSVVGRAVAGGLFLGPLGALVGGMSGVGSKKKQTKNIEKFLVVNYQPSNDSDIKVISFTFKGLTAERFYSALLDRYLKNYKKENTEIDL